MDQAVIDVNHPPRCQIFEDEDKGKGLNQYRTLSTAGLELAFGTVVLMVIVSPHQLTARSSKYFGNACRELKMRDEAFERFET